MAGVNGLVAILVAYFHGEVSASAVSFSYQNGLLSAES